MSSDSNELPRDRVPGTAKKLELISDVRAVGDDTLWGEVGLLSRSRGSEAGDCSDAVDLRSVGETFALLSRPAVSAASAWSVVLGRTGSDELTADVSIVIVGARARRRGVACFGPDGSPDGSDMVSGRANHAGCHRLAAKIVATETRHRAPESAESYTRPYSPWTGNLKLRKTVDRRRLGINTP